MTVYAREIEEIVHPKTSNSVETMPKGTRYITLLYHQVSSYEPNPSINTDLIICAVRFRRNTAPPPVRPQRAFRKINPRSRGVAELSRPNQSPNLDGDKVCP